MSKISIVKLKIVSHLIYQFYHLFFGFGVKSTFELKLYLMHTKFDLILYVPVNNFSVISEPVLSKDKCVLLKDTTQRRR